MRTRFSGSGVRVARLFLALAALLIPVVAASHADSSPELSTQGSEPLFLGFRLGQEVRYALESDDSRRQDRVVHWTITLAEINGSGSQGTFELTYQMNVGGQRLAQAVAEAEINAYGFPLSVVFTAERSTTLGAIGYSIEYEFRGDHLHKELVGGDFDDQEIALEGYRAVNTSFPRGLYLFNPPNGECALAFEQLPAEGTTGGNSGPAEIEELCSGRELVFANPGLLNLAMPTLWESGTGELDFYVFSPTGMRLDLFTAVPGGGGGFTVGGLDLGALLGGGPNPFDDGEVALQAYGLAAGDLLQLDIGGRMVDAWRLAAPTPFTDLYVDGDGSIVRLDLPADPQTGARAWIRRLRPSEF